MNPPPPSPRGRETTVALRLSGFRSSSQTPRTALGVTPVRLRRWRSQVNLADLAAQSWELRPGRFPLNLPSAWQSPAPTASSARSPERRNRGDKLKKKKRREREKESEVSEATEAESKSETAGHKRGVFCSAQILPFSPSCFKHWIFSCRSACVCNWVPEPQRALTAWSPCKRWHNQ